MANVNVGISNNADDGYEAVGAALVSNDGVAAGHTGGLSLHAFYRFAAVTGPASGAFVSSATLTHTVVTVAGDPQTTCYGVDVDNAAAFSDPGNLPSAATRTTASADADPAGTGSRSIDVTSIVQEIINRTGWASGNAMAFVCITSATVDGNLWAADDYGTSPSTAAVLDITYTNTVDGVVFDAISESHTGTTGSTSQASFGWTHTPNVAPKGVAVYVFTNANADYITDVTYGGVSMSQIDEAADTAGEPGRTTLFFLGSGIPTGAQTVTVTRTNNTTVMYAVAISVDASGSSTAIYTSGIVKQSTDGTLSEVSVDDGSPGTPSLRIGGINSGLAAIIDNPGTPGTSLSRGSNSVWGHSIDIGSRVAGVVYEATPGQGSRSIGFSATTSDDRAAVYAAIYSIAGGGGGTPIPVFMNLYRQRWA